MILISYQPEYILHEEHESPGSFFFKLRNDLKIGKFKRAEANYSLR
jgi:hypothetical protein